MNSHIEAPERPSSVETAPSNPAEPGGFQVRLTNFEGPFDLLLQLIFAHRLDVTEVALHQVTDDFIAYTRDVGAQLELEETTAFLVIAATLLDLKAARLLPAGQVDDTEDLALLEVRGIGAWASFGELVAECTAPIEIVGRFLALLELYRARAVAFDQAEPFGVLQVAWTGERPSAGELVDLVKEESAQ